MKAFPDAKVILTVRDPTKWHDSVANAIMRSQEIMRKFPQSVLMSLTCGGKDRLQVREPPGSF